MLKSLSDPFKDICDFESIDKSLKVKGNNVQITGCIDSGLVHMMNLCSHNFKYKVVVTFDEQKAREIYEDMCFFEENCFLYPAKDFIFFNADIQSGQTTTDRLNFLRAAASGRPFTMITTIDGLMDKLPAKSPLDKVCIHITPDSVVDTGSLSSQLLSMGYERLEQVDSPGQFAIRGSIIDIFTPDSPVPYRIDLWGDAVDSIKSFDAESQRTIETLDRIDICPATEFILSPSELDEGILRIRNDLDSYYEALRKSMKTEEASRIKASVQQFIDSLQYNRAGVSLDSYVNYFYENTVSIIDYLDTDNTIFLLDEPVHLNQRASAITEEYKDSISNRLEKGYILPGQSDVMWDYNSILAKISGLYTILFTALDQRIKNFNVNLTTHVSMRNISPYNNSFETLIKDLKSYKKNGFSVIILSGSKTRGKRLSDDLENLYDLNSFFTSNSDAVCKPGQIMILCGSLHKGIEYPSVKYAIISETDIFGTIKKKHRKKNKYSGEKINSFSDLSIGDYVVHENRGLGIYRGIEKIQSDKVVKDYIKIEYADNGNLYVPVTQLDLIQKYASAMSKKPKLNKLGSREWSRTKSQVKGEVMDIAADLVKLYAKRQQKNGFVFGSDTVWQKEFEELFPYEETDDQLAAIEDTKRDMESTKIMDRLICGDVGFGKTEVAIRAAFKAVQDGKQVAFLVPTTILAQQHYNNFVQRMKDFPVTIELMSRFRTKSQQQKTVEGLKKGFVDIVIGTHRLLSKDVTFKDLGLLIIDEEQRFGVAHKEKIKQLKENIDVLTLSATPIPRTLHMSLVGIRDMSVLEEAPMDRLPIQTYVMEYNDEMVREAIKRELNRGGQVYYVYNRVNNIEEITTRLRLLVPDANIEYAHGQMSERKLEQIMYDFINGEIDVLVSTTIIETGLDISNANTMIVHDCDKLGLSQLYQLRGRIGRSNRTSYAFLMYKRDKVLKEVAEKRLQAIKEFTDLGSGFKIAMRDLEIRGAGNILGASQSGHMEAVGYDLYCKMLNESVLIMKGEKQEQEDFETSIDLDIDAYIPASYIKSELTKLSVYKKIAAIETADEYEDMYDELTDRFGEPDKTVLNLLNIALLKAAAHKAYVTEIKGTRASFKISLFSNAPVDINKIPTLIEKYRGDLKFQTGSVPYFMYKPRKTCSDCDEFFKNTMALMENLQTLSS